MTDHKHEWRVSGSATSNAGEDIIIVNCWNCPAMGTIDGPTPNEMDAARRYLDWRWHGDPSRVMVREVREF